MNNLVRARATGKLAEASSRWAISTKVLETMAPSESKVMSRVHSAPVHWIAIDGTGSRFLLSAGADTSICLFDLDKHKRHALTGVQQVEAAARVSAGAGHTRLVSSVQWYVLDTGLFTTSSYDCTVRVWDTSTMAEACQFDLLDRVYSHSMSPTGAHALIAAVADSAYTRLCDLRTGSFAQSLLSHQAGAMATAWSPSEPFILATGGKDGQLKLWDIRRSDTQLTSFVRTSQQDPEPMEAGSSRGSFAHEGAVNALMFTNDADHIVSAGHDNKIQLWKISSMATASVEYQGSIKNAAPHAIELAQTSTDGCGTRHGLVFFPNGDGSISLFETHTGRQVASLSGHFEPPTCAAWRAGGSLELYSGGYDGEIIAWSLPANDAQTEEQADARRDCWSDDGGNENGSTAT
ncbi:hypothetical protein GGI12_000403 [Dipsacomyces acuminosporus]|nr:hypothetical protein GGI12_000403 [Dipsacomyces acuminosporus]